MGLFDYWEYLKPKKLEMTNIKNLEEGIYAVRYDNDIEHPSHNFEWKDAIPHYAILDVGDRTGLAKIQGMKGREVLYHIPKSDKNRRMSSENLSDFISRHQQQKKFGNLTITGQAYNQEEVALNIARFNTTDTSNDHCLQGQIHSLFGKKISIGHAVRSSFVAGLRASLGIEE